MNKEPPEPQPHLWDGTPMAAMPYVISKAGDMPTNHDEPLLERYQREHRVYEGIAMSKAEELANMLDDLYAVDERPIDKETSTELRRLSAINAELLEALQGLVEAEESMRATYTCAYGKTPEDDDHFGHEKWAGEFLLERANAARAAIAKAQGEQL